MTDEDVINTLRWQAWERAKGELLSMGQAMYGEKKHNLKIMNLIREFIKEVELHQ